jgi:3-oxoadipate enol-lactonase
MPKVNVNGIEIYYEVDGEGPKLLYIGGSGADLRRKPNVFDSPLGKNFKILAFDQRGLGQTSKPDILYSMKDYADDAALLLESQGWVSVNVMGSSFGGMVAQELGLRHPAKVKKLVLACAHCGEKGGAIYPLHELSKLPLNESINKFMELFDTRCNEEWRNAYPEKYNESVGLMRKLLSIINNEPDADVGSKRLFKAHMSHDTYDRLPNLTLPVYICGGRYDGLATPQNLMTMHERVPSSKMKLFEGGHLFLNQDPKAYKQIIKFLKS